MTPRATRDRPQVLTIVGARPQLIKAAAVSRAVAKLELVEETLVHTGQHYDDALSGIFFDELQIPAPAINLGVGSGSHGAQTAAMLSRLEEVLLDKQPDAVVVYGDTNSTIAAALAAAKLHLPVAHVEAGLRSFNRRMPEEINRVLTDHCSTWLYAPSAAAEAQLAREGIVEQVEVVGDVMLDVLLWEMEQSAPRSELPSGLEAPYAVATVHRAESTDVPETLLGLIRGLEAVADAGMPVWLPLHPRTRAAFARFGIEPKGIHLIEPVGHRALMTMIEGAEVVITDSGGLQKEAFWLRTPCVTLRSETEWEETVEAGWNTLVGTETETIARAALSAPRPPNLPTPYGDGTAAEKIVRHLSGALRKAG